MADASTQRSLGVMGEKRGCRGLMAREGVGFTHTHTLPCTPGFVFVQVSPARTRREAKAAVKTRSCLPVCKSFPNRSTATENGLRTQNGGAGRECFGATVELQEGGDARASWFLLQKEHFSSSGPSAVEPEPIQLLWGAFRVVVVLLKEVVSTHSLRFSLSRWSNSVWSSQRELTSRLFGLSWCNKI